METLELDKFGLREEKDHRILFGQIAGEQLYFKTNIDKELQLRAEPFLAALLLPAMQRGAILRMPPELVASATFVDNLEVLQDVFTTWFPTLSRAHIEVTTGARDRRESGCAAFFSGGVDACYTLLKKNVELSHLIYVRGIDMQLDQEQLWQQCLGLNRQVADHFRKRLVAVETNVRFFIRRITAPQIGWSQAVGCGIASVAQAVGFPQNYISSSNTFNALHPYGSHPLTDPLLSGSDVKIHHFGCEASRHQKLSVIAEHPALLPSLRVCWQDKGFNCGHCDKCLHFRMALRLLKLKAGGLQPLTDLTELKHAHTGTLGEYLEWKDNLDLAEKVRDQEAHKALRGILNRYKRKQLLKLADDVFLDGKLQARRRRRLTDTELLAGSV